MLSFISRHRAVLKAIRKADKQPFVATFKANNKRSEQLDFQQLPGVALVYSVAAGQEEHLVTLWKGKAAYEDAVAAHEDLFANLQPDWRGYFKLKHPARTRWASLSPYQILIHATAFFGAIFSLHQYYATATSPPNSLISMPAKMEGVAGREEVAEVIFRNVSDTVALQVKQLKVQVNSTLTSGDPWNIVVAPASFSLAPGEELPLQASIPALVAGTYDLELSAKIRGGILGGWSDQISKKTYVVWAQGPSIDRIDFRKEASHIYSLDTAIAVSEKMELTCALTLTDPPDFTEAIVVFPTLKHLPNPERSADGSVTVQRWTIDVVEAGKWHPLSIKIRTRESSAEWKMDDVELLCVNS